MTAIHIRRRAMNRTMAGLFLTLTALAPATALAHGGREDADKKAGTFTLSKGEIVDMACYVAEGEKGASHKKCAALCVKRGMPIGILASDGKLTLLLADHDKEAPYEMLKDLAAETVTVRGTKIVKGGITAIVVEEVTPPAGWKAPANSASVSEPGVGTAATSKKPSAYMCPMGCEGSDSDKPGKCPVCGMDLVPRPAPAVMATEAPAAKKPYYCSMDPDVQSDKPGMCPKCGMDLVKRK